MSAPHRTPIPQDRSRIRKHRARTTRRNAVSRLGLLAFVATSMVQGELTWAQEAPPTGRILRWVDQNPAGAVEHWEWRTVNITEGPWSPIHGVTQLELNGLFYGIAFPPAGVFHIEIRAIAVTGETTTIASAPSNAIRIPSCSDADLTRDGVVGGPDWTELATQWNQSCAATQ